MRQAKNYLLVAVTAAAATLALMFSDAGQVAAQTVKTQFVKIINTADEPVPTAAQGTTNIAGTVGISGTPNVNVANMPTVALAPGSSILVDNNSMNAIPVRDVDNPARQAFQKSFNHPVPAQASGVFQNFTVPVGKRLVIEHVSAQVDGQSGGMTLQIGSEVNSAGAIHVFPLTPVNDVLDSNRCVGSFDTRLYADGGTTLQLITNRAINQGSPELFVVAAISGYLVDVP